jgi:hypothetical protein
MEIVIAHHQQDGRACLPHIFQMKCELWKEVPLALESSALWQQITRNQNKAWNVALDRIHQLLPLGNVLVNVGRQQKVNNLAHYDQPKLGANRCLSASHCYHRLSLVATKADAGVIAKRQIRQSRLTHPEFSDQ